MSHPTSRATTSPFDDMRAALTALEDCIANNRDTMYAPLALERLDTALTAFRASLREHSGDSLEDDYDRITMEYQRCVERLQAYCLEGPTVGRDEVDAFVWARALRGYIIDLKRVSDALEGKPHEPEG